MEFAKTLSINDIKDSIPIYFAAWSWYTSTDFVYGTDISRVFDHPYKNLVCDAIICAPLNKTQKSDVKTFRRMKYQVNY